MNINDQRLEQLLRDAGHCAGSPPEIPPGLAQRVRRLHRRRQRARKIAGGWVVAILLLGGTAATLLRPAVRSPAPDASLANHNGSPGHVERLSADEIERLEAEIARLGAEAQRRRQTAEAMIRRLPRGGQTGRPLWEPDALNPFELARIEFEKTAFLMVEHAGRLAGSAQANPSAEEYRRILEHFPGTNGARTAKQRLGQLSIEKGDL